MRVSRGLARASVVVGREIELDLLGRLVRDARAGHASCTLLIGEGGIGKTRLLGEITSVARRLGLAVLAGRAPVTTPVAFSVVADALRSWLRGHPIDRPAGPFDRGLGFVLPEWADVDNAADLTGAQLRLLALEGIAHVLREVVSANDGAVLLIDDVHEADPESIDVVRYVASARIEGLALIGAMRPNESALADELVRSLRRDHIAEVVALAPLDEQQVSDLLAALLDAQPPTPLVTDIATRSDGVPLLIEELFLAHVRAGTIDREESGLVWRGGSASVPKTIRDVVDARLETLEPAHRTVVVAGAVIGDFKPSLMTAASDMDDGVIAEALAAGVRLGLLETSGGAITFRHAIIREAVLDATVPHLIDMMHRRIAAALRSETPADANVLDRRAHHLIAVGELDEAAKTLTLSAERRLSDYTLLAAEESARGALELAQSPATREGAADVLARVLVAQGRWSESLDLDAATTAQHGNSPAREQRMANAALEIGRPEDAEPIIARLLAADRSSPAVLLLAGRVAVVRGDGRFALDCARQVLDASTDAPLLLDDRFSALDLQARALDFLGDRAGAEASWTQQATEAAALGRTQAQLRAVVQLGKLELFAGRPPQQLHAAVELARAAGALVELAWAQENLHIGLAITGDLAAAAQVADEAIANARALQLDQLAYLIASKAMLESHMTDAVDDLFDEAEAIAPTADLRLHTASMRGDIALRRGRYDDAIEWLTRAVELMRSMPGVVPTDSPCWLAWAFGAAGQREGARRAIVEARRMPDLDRWFGRPLLLDAAEAALDGDESRVDELLTGARATMPLDVAIMRILAAQMVNGPARATWLREALEIYEAAGATLSAERARSALRQAGGAVPRRRKPKRALPEELLKAGVTAREADVLQLVGQGLSNAEIAEGLFLSVRTVEFHVSSLLGKLHVPSRAQLRTISDGLTFDA